MAQTHYPSAGYRGILKVGTEGVWESFPYTRASIAEQPRLIEPVTAGFAGRIGVTEGLLERQGSITLPIFNVTHLNTMLGYFLTETGRATFRDIVIDNTYNQVTYQGYLTKITVSCSPGEAVTAEVGIMGGIVDESVSATPVAYDEAANPDHTIWTPDATFMSTYVNTDGVVSQIPFFHTRMWAVGGTGATAFNADYWKDVSGWEFTIDNQTQTNSVTAADSADPQGYKLHQGLQIGTLSMTLLNPYVTPAPDYRYRPDWNSMIIGFRNTGSALNSQFTTVNFLKLVPSKYGPDLPEPNTRFTQKLEFAIVAGKNADNLSSSVDTGILFQMGTKSS